MKKYIIGSFLSITALIYFTTNSEVNQDVTIDTVKNSAIDKSSKDIKIVYKQDREPKTLHTSSDLPMQVSSTTNPTMTELYKTDKPRAKYQGMQSSQRAYYTQMKNAKKMHKQRVMKRELMLKKHQEQQKFIAMQSVQRQKIQMQRVESTNLRYKSINEKNMQKTISNVKENIKS